jgi:hypothetical protein
MDIQVWEALETIALTPEQVRSALVHQTENGSLVNRSPQLFLPTAYDLYCGFDLNDFLTPFDAKELDGFRLMRSGQRRFINKVSAIHRSGGRIHSNCELNQDCNVAYALVHKFLDCVATQFRDLCQYPGFLGQQRECAVVYSTALTRRLLLESMTAREKPRLIPQLVLPSPRELFSVFADTVEHLPLSLEHASSTFVLERDGGKYRIKQVGERGEVLEDHGVDDLEGAMGRFLRSVFSFDRMDDAAQWKFDPTSLTTQSF